MRALVLALPLVRTLALQYGAATNSTQSMASRLTVVLDAEGIWRLVYDPASVTSDAQDVLEDCEIPFADQACKPPWCSACPTVESRERVG